MNEIFAYPARVVPKKARRFTLLSPVELISLLVAACAIGAAVLFAASNKSFVRHNAAAGVPGNEWAIAANNVPAKAGWVIRGQLSETCTCAVPCTCNFGQGPSPHSYCYPFYSYDIREGRYGDVSLNGLHIGAADLQNGQTIFIDERADAKQREALRIIAARVIGHASPEETDAKLKEISPRIRYAAITQEYGDRHNHLLVAGLGEFAADYIMGLDDSQPLTVRNNTTWRIKDSIKAKTSVFRVHAGRDAIDTKNTNSNQGEFEYTDKTDFGSPAAWACGGASACGTNNMHRHGGGENGGNNKEDAESCHR